MNNNEEYVSLYDYLGTSPKEYGISKKVAATAIEQKIQIKYRILPESLQTDRYKSVMTYPISFLDKYFQDSEMSVDKTPFVRRSELIKLQQRLEALEAKFDAVIKKLDAPTKLEDDYDLPF